MNRITRLATLFAVAAIVAGCATATLLANGKVLLISGISKLYDPGTGMVTVGPMPSTPRVGHTATLLGNGLVLVIGGLAENTPEATAELYDPNTGAFTPTGSLLEPRSFHTATLLNDGRVLVVGGGQLSLSGDDTPPLATAELYDPNSGTFSATGSVNAGRLAHTATLLTDGRVLIIGGSAGSDTLGDTEIYDPNSGTFSTSGSLAEARSLHTATLLADGKVLVAGGNPPSGATGTPNAALTTTEIFDPGSGAFSAGPALTEGRSGHSATLLQDGKVLLAGGMIPSEAGLDALNTAELLDPVAGTSTPTGTLVGKMALHVAVRLGDGKVLLAGPDTTGMGGQTQNQDPLSSVEIYDPASGTFSAVTVELWTPSPSPT